MKLPNDLTFIKRDPNNLTCISAKLSDQISVMSKVAIRSLNIIKTLFLLNYFLKPNNLSSGKFSKEF